MARSIRNTLAALGFMALGATSMLALDASAGGPGHGPPPIPGAGLARAMSQLDLTEAQDQALADLKEEVRAEMMAGHSERKGDAVDQLLAGRIDRAEMHRQIDEEAARRTAMAHRITDRVLDIYDSLSPDQKAQLVDLIEEHQERREQMRDDGARGERGEGEDREGSRRR